MKTKNNIKNLLIFSVAAAIFVSAFSLTVSAATGDDCTDPIIINIPADLDYNDLGQTTCGRGDNYTDTDLDLYDGGEDIIYQLDVSSLTAITITITSSDTYIGVGLFDDCPDVGSLVESDTGSSGPWTFDETLSVGTYYLMVDSWPSPDCVDFDLTIEQSTLPEPELEYFKTVKTGETENPYPCDYEICLSDSFGDGWNGNTLNVSVNGVLIYTDLTITDGNGPECYPLIGITEGDVISMDYTNGGDFQYENDYDLYDCHGNNVLHMDCGDDADLYDSTYMVPAFIPEVFWGEYLEAEIGSIQRFNLSIHNNGTETGPIFVQNIIDLLPDCLDYVPGTATVNGVPYEPDDISMPTLTWNNDGAGWTLNYCEWIYIEFDVEIFGPAGVDNINWVQWNIVYNEMPYAYADNATIHPTEAESFPVINLDTGEEFLTIQAAIDDTDTLVGHTIAVSDVTYEPRVNVTIDDLTFDLSGISGVSGVVAENKSYNLAEYVESTFIGSTSLVFDGMQINTTGGNTVTVNNLNIRINNTADEMMDTTDAPMLVNGQGNEIVIEGVNKFDGRDDKIEFSGNIYYPYGAPGIRVQANRYKPNDELIISGSGELTALGASWCAGIGGSGYRYAGNVSINSGTIIAEGHSLGAGIGGGQDSGRQDETATGSEHNWRPEPSPQVITINGGDVTATGGYGGAGIGTGGDCYNDTHGGTITINAGTVHANGGAHGAGIGCGQSNAYELDHGTGGDITITDGTIYAISGGDNASGIGGGGTYGDQGLGGNCGTICIYPAATIYATGGANVDDIGPGLNGDECEFCDLNEDPTAAFSYDPVDPTTGDLIQFTDESTDSDGVIVNWTWDFGDGTISYDQDPTHQYTIADTYTVCLTVTDDDGATDTICESIVVDEELIEVLDIEQAVQDRPFLVRHASDGDWGGAQNFTPTVTTITKVELYMKVLGNPDFDLNVELREDSIDGTLLDTITMTPGEFSSDWEWIELDFADVSVAADTDYFVVLASPPAGMTNTFGYGWGYSLGDTIDDSSLWFTRTSGSFWLDLPELYDFTFRVYGYEVFVDQPPTACFDWTDADGSGAGTVIDFDAGCSTDDVGISSYEWDWENDGIYDATGVTQSYDFGDTDPHIVTLRVTDTIAQTDTVTHIVQVSTESELKLNQSWYDGGSAATSAYATDGAEYIDYEAADNFDIGAKGSIDKVVAYGLTLFNDDGTWVEMTPDSTEPFNVRFYEYEEEVDILEAPTTGTYQIALLDDYGDGWNGNSVTVYVNGNPVLTDITLSSGAGPEYHDFTANAGDEISTTYTGDSWPTENYYAILDPSDNIIAEQGGTWDSPGDSTPGDVGTGETVAVEPEWSNPVSEQQVIADVEFYNMSWDETYSLYKFEMELDTAVNMDNGWVSVQIDADNGSGTWFLWMNSLDGDLFSWQRAESSPRADESTFGLSKEGAPLDTLEYDFALELWG